MKRIAGVLLVILAVAGVLWADSALSINGAGATFPYPMYSKWFDEYHKKNANLQINYQPIGSGGGIKQVTEGTVDFGATDGPMNDEQLKAYQDKHGFGILHFPTVLGAAVPAYNIPGVTAELNFRNGMIPPFPAPIKGLLFLEMTSLWCTGRKAVVQPTSGPTTFQKSAMSGKPKLARVPQSTGQWV